MLGSVKLNEYRTDGDTLALSNQNEIGTFKAGLWYDSTTNTAIPMASLRHHRSEHDRSDLSGALQGGGARRQSADFARRGGLRLQVPAGRQEQVVASRSWSTSGT